MQKTILIVLFFLKLIPAFCQQPTISPEVTDEQCPNTNVYLHFNFGTFSAQYYTLLNDNTTKGCTIISNINSNGDAIIQFSDKKEDHKLSIRYAPPTTSITYTFTFTKI